MKANVVTREVEAIFKSEGNIKSSLAKVVTFAKNKKLKFNGMVSFVASFYEDWPLHKKSTTRAKKGAPVSLTTIKMGKTPEMQAFKKTDLFKKVNAFERNFRRYYEAGKTGAIVEKKPSAKKAPKKRGKAGQDRNPLETSILNLEKELNRIKRYQKDTEGIEDVVESLSLTIKIFKMVNK